MIKKIVDEFCICVRDVRQLVFVFWGLFVVVALILHNGIFCWLFYSKLRKLDSEMGRKSTRANRLTQIARKNAFITFVNFFIVSIYYNE